MTTCQICGRAIKANTGLIAHHGYTRPGGGWQTASCMGARHRPYEVACDRIPDAIRVVEAHLSRTAERLAKHIAEPPEELREPPRINLRPSRTFKRPDGFTPPKDPGSYSPGSYEGQWIRLHHEYVRAIQGCKVDLKYFTERLTNWVAS